MDYDFIHGKEQNVIALFWILRYGIFVQENIVGW